MSADLPDRPSLEHLKKQARERLRELQLRSPGARLADAQHAIARDYGFPSWPKLKAHVDAVTAARAATHGAPATPPSSSLPGESNRAGVQRALALQLRDSERGGVFGVALLIPAVRCAATFVGGAVEARERKLALAVWREIDNWVKAGDSGLPAEPDPLKRTVVTALLESDRPTLSAHRSASFSLKVPAGALSLTATRLLPQLLTQCARSNADRTVAANVITNRGDRR